MDNLRMGDGGWAPFSKKTHQGHEIITENYDTLHKMNYASINCGVLGDK